MLDTCRTLPPPPPPLFRAPQVLLRAPPAPPGPDFVLFDQFWVGTGGGPLPGPGQGGLPGRRQLPHQRCAAGMLGRGVPPLLPAPGA